MIYGLMHYPYKINNFVNHFKIMHSFFIFAPYFPMLNPIEEVFAC